MSYTTKDRNDANLRYGSDNKPVEQNKAYLVLSDEELDKGYIKPFRTKYLHLTCKTETIMSDIISKTYATDPWFYGATYCCGCQMHRPLREFIWLDGESMDPSQWSQEESVKVKEFRNGKV